MLRKRDEDSIRPYIMEIAFRSDKRLILLDIWLGSANEWSFLVFDLPAASGYWVDLFLGQSSRKEHTNDKGGSESNHQGYCVPQRVVYSIASLYP